MRIEEKKKTQSLYIFKLRVAILESLLDRCARTHFSRSFWIQAYMNTFKIPASPLDLLIASDELTLSVQQDTAVAELKPEDVQIFADGIGADAG